MWKRKVALLAGASLLTLTACSSQQSDQPTVAASFYPLAWVAQEVAGPDAQVINLTTPGTEPHDLELTVKQTAQIAKADVVFYEKGLQPSVDDAVASSTGSVVEATEYASLVGGSAGKGSDPHVWLDPTQLSKIAAGFTESISKADPDHADGYRARGELLQRNLAKLDRDLQRGLKTCSNRTVVVAHDAFGYLGRRYDLHIVPIAGLSPDAEPSAKQLAAIKKAAQQAKVTTVFSETLASPALADTLARELGVETAVLDPIEGLAEGSKDDYITLMRANLDALRKANQCS